MRFFGHVHKSSYYINLFFCCLCITDLDDRTDEYECTMEVDAHSNKITKSYALINNSESHIDSKTCYTLLLSCLITFYLTQEFTILFVVSIFSDAKTLLPFKKSIKLMQCATPPSKFNI